MIRIAGVDIPEEKRADISLTYLYGIGRRNVLNVLKEANIEAGKRMKDLSEDELNRVSKIIEKKFVVEGDLRRSLQDNIKRLIDIRSYRGSRHSKRLPSRGQRTRTNARTKRGKRMTVGALKKEDRAKTDDTKPTAQAETKQAEKK